MIGAGMRKECTIIYLDPTDSIELLNEQHMADAGWIRKAAQ
jgi:hypothetical protein